MKQFFTLIFVVFSVLTYGQLKTQKTFKMPAGAKYLQGQVRVKVKSEFKAQFESLSSNTQVKINSVTAHKVAQIATRGMIERSSSSARMGAPRIDISKYFYITFDRSQNVEEYINNLYATGYFEIVEPEYKNELHFTPNDPDQNKQYYLGMIKAFDAWDITKGDTTVVVAIIDTGGNLTHPDLAPNLFRNWHEIRNNGVDDDGNGFIDDYQGWDFVGADTLNLYQPDYTAQKYGDNNPSITPIATTGNVGDLSHGTWVAGCASASTNDGVGMAGVGYKTRLMFTKQTADNQKPSSPSEYRTLQAMMYAADLFELHHIRGIINCSFGGPGYSQIDQDIINHIVLDQNCLIVASAGNAGNNLPNYPAAYDNVLSVAATTSTDLKSSFSTFGTTVDISAPGSAIYTTQYNSTYGTVQGTSFSSPLTSGAAALVWAKNPTFTAQQVGEQLRVTADATSLYTVNPSRVNQLGKGRLDILRALTIESPSVRALNRKLVNQIGLAPGLGDKAYLTFDFKNYLKATSALQISISTTSTAVAITKSTISPGIISEGSVFTNNLSPFELTVQATAGANSVVNLLINYSDGTYTDYQWVTFIVNPSYIDVAANLVQTTISSGGRLGFQDPSNSAEGIGFNFDGNQMLFEMGLIMGTSTSTIYNNVRGVNGTFDQDFSATTPIKQIVPGERTYSEVFGQFSNSTTAANQAVVVDYRSLVMKESPYDKFVILEYKVKNPTANPMSNFYFGIFSDWDITTNGHNDAADWDNSNKMGYVYPASGATNLPYAGIQLLTGSPAYYAIDNDGSLAGNPWGLYNGSTQSFTNAHKFATISAAIGSGNERVKAGQLPVEAGAGGDVSQVVSSGPYNIAAGATITIAFALHGTANLSDLKTSARYADSLYNYTMLASKPVASPVSTCYNGQATLNASGASTLKWYNDFTGGQSFHTGTQIITGNLKHDTVFYVSNADHKYESVRTAVNVTLKANPKVSVSGSTTVCLGDKVTLSVAPADSTIWNTGAKTNSIDVSAAGKYAVRLKDNALACVSKSDTVVVTTKPKPTANFTVSSTDLRTQLPITFTDQSTSAVSYLWDFGDGKTSTDKNPTHTFDGQFNSVSLTVTGANGCTDTKAHGVDLVTALKESQLNDFSIYPNPVALQDLHIVIDNEDMNQARVVLTNSIGQVILDRDISTTGTHVELTIPSAALNQGLNFIRLNVAGKMVTKKVVKVQ